MTDELRVRLTFREWAMLMGVLLVALLPGFFSIPVMDRDEARYSQAASQMMETGDYVDIRFQEDPRWVKPAGIYWMQVATAAPFGGPDAPIWAFRLPSLFGVLIGAGVTAWLGARILGAQGGVIAGSLLGLTLMAAVEARTAKTDAMLLAAGVFAQAALYFLLVRAKEPPKFIGAPLIFWAATGAALMIKGPIVTLVSASTLAVYGIWTRDWSVLKRIRPLPGVLVAAAIALPWLLAINLQTDWGFFEKSVGHALLGKVAESDDSHGGPIGYHTLLLSFTFWPGTLLLGLAGILAWTRRQDSTVRFLISWLIPTWIIFELIQTKLPHYIFPAMPALAILAAWGAMEAGSLLKSKWPKRIHTISVRLFIIATVILAAVPLGGQAYLHFKMIESGIYTFNDDIMIIGVIAVILGFLTIEAGLAVARNPDNLKHILLLLIASTGIYWAVFQGAFPGLKVFWASHEVAKQVAQLEGCDEIIATTAGYREPSNVRYLGTRTYLADTGEQAAQFLKANKACGVAIIDRADRLSFDAAMTDENVIPVGLVDGYNYVKGRVLVLDILIHEDADLRISSAE